MILIILSIAASYLTINSLISGAQSETQARETMMMLEEVVSDFKTAESSQRRYLLTNTVQDFAAYQQARARSQRELQRLDATAGANQDWRALAENIHRRFGFMEQAIAARQQQGVEAAAAILSGASR
jgi:CHASE3 domain sensor protein